MPQEIGASAAALEQRHLLVREENLDGNSRQAGPAAHVQDVARGMEKRNDGDAIDQVPPNHQLGFADRSQVQALVPPREVRQVCFERFDL